MITTTITTMTMSTDASDGMLTLLAWLSPAFPVGAFSYSHGLEWAIETGDITDLASLVAWVGDVLEAGTGLVDATILHAAMTLNDADLRDLAELAAALHPTRERRMESLNQGRAFLDTVSAAWPAPGLDRLARVWDGPVAYPVAVAMAARAHGIDARLVVPAYLQAFAANLVSAAVRLVPLGQTDGQRAVEKLLPLIRRVAAEARTLSPETVGGACLRSDIASMRHETQYTRLFRS